MSGKEIIKADLYKLLPTYSEAQLPAELISLTRTILAQTQQLSLNSAELPAKHFLCTHLACDRLALKLQLPERNANGAPIPQKVYQKLYQRARQETQFRQVKDSGRSGAESRRKTARDSAKEICGRDPSVPIAMVLQVIDKLVEKRPGMTDTRAMVVAVFLLCFEAVSRGKGGVSASKQKALMLEYGLSKQDLEFEIDKIEKLSHGKGWFDLEIAKKLDVGAQIPKKKARITQVRMVSVPRRPRNHEQ